MSTEQPNRRPGPHAPLPSVAAAVGTAISEVSPPSSSAPPREEDPRARAARRAAELRDHLGTMEENTDEFYIDPADIPDGWSYEWKRFTLLGKEDPSYQVGIAHRGWEPVPRSRHPKMMPTGATGETIERKGLVLMERPKEVTDEVKSNDYRRARAQVRDKETQLGAAPIGTFERDNKGTPLASVKKSYEPIPIPK